jgi:nucleotide-binding universal stress UspA family protein
VTWNGLPAALNVARHYLDHIAGRVPSLEGAEAPGAALPVQIEALPGQPAATIVDYAAQRPSIRWIAMATHGRSGVARWLYGSVAEQVLRTASTPLLLVRPPALADAAAEQGTPWRHIVVPLDGSALAEQVLPQAQMLAAASKATLHLVSAQSITDDALVRLASEGDHLEAEAGQRSTYLAETARHLRESGLEVEIHSGFGEPDLVIASVAAEVQASLIMMATHGRSGFQQLRLGSVALQVVHHATQPVLLVRATLPPLRQTV